MADLPPIPPRGSNSAGKSSSSVRSDKRDYVGEAKAADFRENPFRLPADDQIFRLREEEKRKKEEERARCKDLKIWDKSHGTAVMSRSGRLKELAGIDKTVSLTEVGKNFTEGTKVVMPRRQEKENMNELIAKKREMFLVQMSLDTKREEIRKLEEKAQMKEEALQRSEQMLEEDAMRFDAFLKENDKKAHEAIKKAEDETKRKQEKTQEIKRLTQQIQALNSEMTKHGDALYDCMKYKEFLDKLTPPEWFEQHKLNQEQKRENIKKDSYDAKYKEWDQGRRRMIDARRKELEVKKEARKKNNKRQVAGATAEEEEAEELLFRQSIPVAPKLEDEVCDIADEEPPMYFVHPQQLMDIFAALEEQNLFLIQNSQETEHTLEELNQQLKETRLSMDAQTGQLQYQIVELHNQIESEDNKAKALRLKRENAKLESSAGSGADVVASAPTQAQKEKLLSELHAKVAQVYEECGFDGSSKPSCLFMLSQLESKLEVLLADVEKMPQDYVIKAEKEKEKRRRERKREEQQAQQEQQQEERNRRAVERSLQAPKKRNGRPLMFRSKPSRGETKNNGDDGNRNKDNNDEAKFLS